MLESLKQDVEDGKKLKDYDALYLANSITSMRWRVGGALVCLWVFGVAVVYKFIAWALPAISQIFFAL